MKTKKSKSVKRLLCLATASAMVAASGLVASASTDYTAVKDYTGTDIENYADWANGSLWKFADNGWMNGVAENTYAPANSMTRAEFAAFVVRVKGLTGTADLSAYTDMQDTDKWYYETMQIAVANGLLKGCDDGTLQPESPISRAEAITIVARLYGETDGTVADLEAGNIVDIDEMQDWQIASCGAMVREGLISGSAHDDGKIYMDAAKTMSRVEGVVMLDRLLEAEDYTYAYAALSYSEYWANEDVYAAGDTTSSDGTDTRGESDLGAYDTVTRATTNHGLHRGSFQQSVIITDTDGNTYEVSSWTEDQSGFVTTDGTTYSYSKGTITKADGTTATVDHYNITGIKYVPVKVKTSDYEDFKSKYDVTENGETLVGGYSEKSLSSYTYTAAVDENTNGLKTATKNADGTYSFSARQTGTGSGLEGVELQKATDITETVKDYNGSYGEFLRFDLTGDYGGLGSAMQTVEWTYYGDDSTYTTAVASYGTKFAADNWMHKSNGIQLGLTDSLRCQLPEGTDGTGYWTVTVYGLGYEDYTAKIKVEDNNVGTVVMASDEQVAQLQTLYDQAVSAAAGAADSDAKTQLQNHIEEAAAALKDPRKATVEELLSELPDLIAAVSGTTAG